MKKVFFPWGKKNRNPQPPPTPPFDELTSSPGILVIIFVTKKILIFTLALGFLVYLQYYIF